MSFRFWRRVKIAPGVTLNLSKSGGSLSFGPRGAKFTVGPRGTRTTVGVPGTGMYYTTRGLPGLPKKRKRGPKRSARRSAPPPPTVVPKDRLTLGFFKRLVVPKEEQDLVAGCRELTLGSEQQAFAHLRRAVHLADGAFFAGVLALKRHYLGEAEQYLLAARSKAARLGAYFSKYQMDLSLSLAVTAEITAHVGPTRRGVLLALVETCQALGSSEQALSYLKELGRLAPDDPVVRLSLAELLLESRGESPAACRQVVRLTKAVRNDSAVHGALLLYRSRALRQLGLATAAREILTATLRRKKDRPTDLLHALHYERALVYEALGEKKRARRELEKLYAEAPDFEDVGKRLGLGF